MVLMMPTNSINFYLITIFPFITLRVLTQVPGKLLLNLCRVLSFPLMFYHDRKTRNQFVASHFRHTLGGSVLNVDGGGSNHLASFISPVSYTEIDIAGSPDIVFDLDCGSELPLSSNSYDCVVCTDVLEHLENFHLFFSNSQNFIF